MQRTNLLLTGMPKVMEYSESVFKVDDQNSMQLKEGNEHGVDFMQHKYNFIDDIRRLVMFGAAQCGKTATGNMILGEAMFFSEYKTKQNLSGNVIHQTKDEARRFQKVIKIVKTPGISILDLASEDKKAEVVRNINQGKQLLGTEPDAYLYVISSTKNLESETKVIDLIYRRMRNLMEKIILVFTGFDHFKDKNMTRFSFLDNLPPKLKTFIADCGGENRVVFFDNSRSFYEDIANIQVKKLFKVIDEMLGIT